MEGVCQDWLRGNDYPTDKEKLHLSEVWVGPPRQTPSLFKKKNQGEGDVGPRANKIYSNEAHLGGVLQDLSCG